MVNHVEIIPNVAASTSSDTPSFLAMSHVTAADSGATNVFPSSSSFYVKEDVINHSSSSANTTTMSSPSSRAKAQPKYHQVDDDHIPIPPIFFPNPGRHVNHHVHVMTPTDGELSLTAVLSKEEEITEVTTFNDLVAGGIAGTVSVFVGHPFDTFKVRCQTGTGTALKPSITSILSLFRGMGPPLCTAGAVNALVFSAYGWSSRLWETTTEPNVEATRTAGAASGFKLKQFMCGAFSGLLQTFILCPTEHIKCRLQVQEALSLNTSTNNNTVTTSTTNYKGPTDAAHRIYNSHGIFRGLYRGWTVTACREIPAFGFYFSTYEYIKDYTKRKLDSTSPSLKQYNNPWIASALAGGASGCFTWVVVYPFDVIKTRIQTRSLSCTKGIYRTGLDIIAESGWRGMFRGLGVTLIRAFPVNGVIFPVYEFTLLKLTGADRMVD